MKTFILILYIYAGPWAKGDSVTMFSVPGFNTLKECQAAGDASKPLTYGSAKEFRFVCLEQSK